MPEFLKRHTYEIDLIKQFLKIRTCGKNSVDSLTKFTVFLKYLNYWYMSLANFSKLL